MPPTKQPSITTSLLLHHYDYVNYNDKYEFRTHHCKPQRHNNPSAHHHESKEYDNPPLSHREYEKYDNPPPRHCEPEGRGNPCVDITINSITTLAKALSKKRGSYFYPMPKHNILPTTL